MPEAFSLLTAKNQVNPTPNSPHILYSPSPVLLLYPRVHPPYLIPHFSGPSTRRAFFNFQALYLDHTRLQSVPSRLLYHTPLLTTLEMSEAEINHLPWGFFDRSQDLRSLFLTGRGVLGTAMDLREIKPGAFDALRALERLDLARNWNLRPVHPRLLHKLTALRRLELAGTPAASDAYLAPGFFFPLSNMEDLSFEATPIRELPILPPMPKVRYITYYSLQLRRIPRGYFDGYPDLYQTDKNRVRFTNFYKHNGIS